MKTITKHPKYVIDDDLNINQNNWDSPEHLALGQTSMNKLFRTIAIQSSKPTVPLKYSEKPLDVENMEFCDPLLAGKKISGEQLLNRRLFNDGLLVMHRGEVVHESYRNGFTESDHHVIHSCTKSLCAMIVSIAIEEGKLRTNERIVQYLPEYSDIPAWQEVTLQHVLDMQAGIEYSEDYTNPDAHYWHYARAAGYYPPNDGEQAVGVKAWMIANLNRQNHQPGTAFVYNSCLANILGMVLEKAYDQTLGEVFESKLFEQVPTERPAYFNTDSQGFPITEGQLNLTLRDFARVSSLMSNQGENLSGKQVIPTSFIEQLPLATEHYQNAYQKVVKDPTFPTGYYKNQFWVFKPQLQQFSMLGIHGQFAWFDIPNQLMITGLGSYPTQDSMLMMKTLDTLWSGISLQIEDGESQRDR